MKRILIDCTETSEESVDEYIDHAFKMNAADMHNNRRFQNIHRFIRNDLAHIQEIDLEPAYDTFRNAQPPRIYWDVFHYCYRKTDNLEIATWFYDDIAY